MMIFRAVTLLSPTVLADNASDSLHELLSFHHNTHVSLCQNPNLFSNGLSCDQIIACDHSDLDSCDLALSDSFRYLFPSDVSDSDDPDTN